MEDQDFHMASMWVPAAGQNWKSGHRPKSAREDAERSAPQKRMAFGQAGQVICTAQVAFAKPGQAGNLLAWYRVCPPALVCKGSL